MATQSVPVQLEHSETTENVDWKIKRNEALARARDKAYALRKQIRDADPDSNVPKAKTKLTDKLKKLKLSQVNDTEVVAIDEKVNEAETKVDIVDSAKDVTADPPVTEKLIEIPVETIVKPKKVRKTAVKTETAVKIVDKIVVEPEVGEVKKKEDEINVKQREDVKPEFVDMNRTFHSRKVDGFYYM